MLNLDIFSHTFAHVEVESVENEAPNKGVQALHC
jgi:hypothetical protein